MPTAKISDADKLSMAKRIAREHKFFIVTKLNNYLLYRQIDRPEGSAARNELIGSRSTIEGIYILVRKCCNK